jgi:hypothetical protein
VTVTTNTAVIETIHIHQKYVVMNHLQQEQQQQQQQQHERSRKVDKYERFEAWLRDNGAKFEQVRRRKKRKTLRITALSSEVDCTRFFSQLHNSPCSVSNVAPVCMQV